MDTPGGYDWDDGWACAGAAVCGALASRSRSGRGAGEGLSGRHSSRVPGERHGRHDAQEPRDTPRIWAGRIPHRRWRGKSTRRWSARPKLGSPAMPPFLHRSR